jgi:4-hydroxybenzoate polyprenyltransferase
MPFLQMLRPIQWSKNVFVFAPLVFSRHLFDAAYVERAIAAFAVFSLVSSVVYIVNDIADRAADRMHPLKRLRPIASGTVSVGQAIAVGAVLLAVAGLGAHWLGMKTLFITSLYLLLNLGYSFGLKQVILVDVFIVASGFMLRVLAGVFAIGVQVSPWLVLCTLFVSVFLAVSKRRAEILLNIEQETDHARPVLRHYDLQFIEQMMTVTAAGMAISYALYTVAERTVEVFGTENLIFTTVFVLFGIFRYLYLMRSRKTDDNPTHLLLSDLPTLLNIAAWFMACVAIIYHHELRIFLGWT